MTGEKIGENVVNKSFRHLGGSNWARNQRLRLEIVALLNETRKPMTVQEVIDEVECAWVTGRQILTDLVVEGKVKFFTTRQGHGRLYQINKEWVDTKAAEKPVV